MKKQNSMLCRWSQALLATLLAWMGFSCSHENGWYDEPAMYGTPFAHFEIKGQVLDPQKRPVRGAQIEVKDLDTAYPWLSSDTIYTDEEGKFSWQKGGFPTLRYQLITSGPDGDRYAGAYTPDTSVVVFNREEMTGAEGWYDGRGVRDTVVTLKNFTEWHTSPYTLYTFHGVVTDKEGHPLAGILISTRPDYQAHEGNSSYAAITNEWGKYAFTLDKASAAEHVFYASLADFWWNMPAYRPDSVTVDFREIPLTDAQGLLAGRGEKQINFQLVKN